jgi:hypothetical protein
MAVDLNSYGGLEIDIGCDGQILDSSIASVETRINQSATAIEYGRAVVEAANDGCAMLATGTGVKICGISVKNVQHAKDPSGNGTNYPQYDPVDVMKIGPMCITALENADDGDAVIAVVAQNGRLGSVKNGAADGTTRILVPNTYWKGAQTAGSKGKIQAFGAQTIKTTYGA